MANTNLARACDGQPNDAQRHGLPIDGLIEDTFVEFFNDIAIDTNLHFRVPPIFISYSHQTALYVPTKFLKELIGSFPAVEVLGARQVGKSTLTEQVSEEFAGSGTTVLSFTMDDPETRSVAQSDPRGFLSQNPEGMMVIDEFQRVPELILPLKAEVDRFRRPARFLITGSSKLTTGAAAADNPNK